MTASSGTVLSPIKSTWSRSAVSSLQLALGRWQEGLVAMSAHPGAVQLICRLTPTTYRRPTCGHFVRHSYI